MLLISLHFFALLPSFSITMNFAETYIERICDVLPTIIHGLLCTLHAVFLLQGCTESKSWERKYEGMIIPARNESDRHSQQSLQQTILYLVKTWQSNGVSMLSCRKFLALLEKSIIQKDKDKMKAEWWLPLVDVKWCRAYLYTHCVLEHVCCSYWISCHIHRSQYHCECSSN